MFIFERWVFVPEGSFVVSAAKCRGDNIAKIYLFQCFFQCFSRFSPFPKNVLKTGVVFVAAAGGCLVKLSAWKRRYLVFICTLNPFMSWLILQNDRQFPGLGKAGSLLCKIGRGKSNYCCEVWRDAWPPCVFLFLIGWIAGDCEASRNYRHYVSQYPVS